jgi:hypothetical protein
VRNKYGNVEFDKDTRLPIIRRSLLNDSSIDVSSDISDPDKLMVDAELNRQRAKASKDIETWRKLDQKVARGDALVKREITTMTNLRVSLKAELGQDFETVEDAQTAYDTLVTNMQAAGTSNVSEANLHSFVYVPPDTVWRHLIELHHPSDTALGLFMEAWNHKTCFNPHIGGNIARGCGGYLEGTYTVKRQEGNEWITDCVVTVKPDEGVSLSRVSNTGSVVRSAWDAWKSVDITQFVFDYNEIRRLLNETTEGEA